MDLVLFDIDGTLTQSQSIDTEIYLRSLSAVFGFARVNPDWSTYRHTTDSGILHELCVSRLGRAPTGAESAAFRAHFVDAIETEAAREPFRQIDGAGAVLNWLVRSCSCCIALATGGWGSSARCKMYSAGMEYDAFASASADDALSRPSIMQIAIDRAISRHGGRRPDTIVYVGDGIWDARACRQLRVPLIGIATGTQADVLRAGGACEVLPNYADTAAFSTALSCARRRFLRRDDPATS
jgi:phosphoglycolate phosphatase-like HAD superfamily hydrolase